VILNTEQNGAAKIQEDTENLKQEFEKLMIDVQDLRQKLTSRAAQLEEIQKVLRIKEFDKFCLYLSCKCINCIFVI
jgi:nesprin-1